jgi:hypothetical protein
MVAEVNADAEIVHGDSRDQTREHIHTPETSGP